VNILGISAFFHDSAAALIRDGRIVAAAQEERFTRKKHDDAFPKRAAEWCLSEAGITAADLDAVVFYEKPLIKFERLLESALAFAPQGFPAFVKAMPQWLQRKLHLPREIDKGLGGDYSGPILFATHHESHAASAFYPSPFDDAAILTLDGVGEWSTATWGTGRGNQIRLEAEMRFPHSPGLLYSAFTLFCGFRVNSGEYKLMGLAPYGDPRFAELILREIVDLRDDGSFWLDQRFFDYCAGLRMTSRRFDRLFGGPPRNPEGPLTQREMDLAASIQKVLEEIVLRMARYVHARTRMPNLCLAGGVALNCVANGRLLREGPFKDIWIQPAAGDAGGALGAALFAWHSIEGKERTADNVHDSMKGACLGPEFADDEIGAWLKSRGYPGQPLGEAEWAPKLAELIATENVVGLCEGRMEFGPRALGGRSIIGDARSSKMQSVMNLKIKFRESFRPFAPTAMVERTGDFFELDRPSPYMLLVAPVRPERCKTGSDGKAVPIRERVNMVRSDVPAITHVDYSARVQTVDKAVRPRYHSLIQAFEKRTGYGIIINTSFNVRGEPIICTPEDAYRCFMRTEMDYLVLGSFLLSKKEQPPWKDHGNWRQDYVLD
jgi:carbamoyltransferase